MTARILGDVPDWNPDEDWNPANDAWVWAPVVTVELPPMPGEES